ncbi:MAG: hypothetical protein IKC46_05260, partial [Lachnospiraceae bacterium]|nr:hypothetical protein [Lachnospiraceae bacterium]
LLFVLGFCSSEFSSQDLPVSCLSIRLGKALSVELFRVALLFICQGTSSSLELAFVVVSSDLAILACRFLFVNNFF